MSGIVSCVLGAIRRRHDQRGTAISLVRLPTFLYREFARELEPNRALGEYDALPPALYLGSLCIQDAMDGT